MNILFLNLTQGLADRGLERVVDLYAHALSKKHLVTLVQAGPVIPGKSYKTLRSFRLDLPPQPAPHNFFEKLLFRFERDPASAAARDFTLASLATIKKINPDVIIACNGAPQLRLLKLAIPTTKIAVFGAAGLGHHDIKTLKSGPDIFIAMTEYQAKWCKSYVRSDTHIVVIPNPVLISEVANKIKLSLPRPIVLTVGALSQYKNIVSTVESLLNLSGTHVIIGDGEERGKLQDILSQRTHDFRWIKHLDHRELRAYYQACDVFCFTPDPREAFGNVYIEAMASSLPIVATDDPIRREIIGKQGYFVDPTDKMGVRSAVIQAYAGGRVDYRPQLARYNIKVAAALLEKALNELTHN